ncbi:MAG TPA: carbohydrate ABC transporter permease [Armatimonadota bacterium]|jgi:multiple sugar transport system permease protein
MIATKKQGKGASSAARAALWHLLMVALAIVPLLPFIWMVSTSLKVESQVFTVPPQWIPRPARWANYPDALSSFPFLRYTANTLVICLISVVGTTLSCSLVAYGFSRIQWRGRDTFFIVMLATLMLPAQATMLPVFLLFRWLHWIGTIKPLTVPAFFGSAFFIFLLRQFFLTIPQELSDAARIDGCSELGIFSRVILPLARPALATVALFTFIGGWLDYLGPLIYLHDESQYTLALGLQAFLGRHGAEWNLLMAASTVVTVPLLVVFFLAQGTFVKGIALTGIKG